MELEGYGEISAGNAVDAIAQSKKNFTFHRILAGLNIPQVGWVTARNLAAHFRSIEPLAGASQEEIQEVEGIGPDRAEAIAEWFSDEENQRLVEELRGLGLRFESGDELKPARRPARRADLRHHGHARVVHARRGREGARGEGREGRELGVEEDGRRHRRRGAGLEAAEGPAGRRPDPRRTGAEVSTGQLGRPRSGPARGVPSTSRPANRSG